MMPERDVLREVEAALDVLPSPGFEARVRDRVLAEPMRAPRWIWPAGVVVAATIVLAVMLVPHRQAPDSPVAVRPAEPSAPTTVATITPPEPTGAVTEARVAVPRRSRRGDTTVIEGVRSPEVVVPTGQMAAIQRLVDEVARGRVVMAPERRASTTTLEIAALAPARPIVFDDLEIAPLSADASVDAWR